MLERGVVVAAGARARRRGGARPRAWLLASGRWRPIRALARARRRVLGPSTTISDGSSAARADPSMDRVSSLSAITLALVEASRPRPTRGATARGCGRRAAARLVARRPRATNVAGVPTATASPSAEALSLAARRRASAASPRGGGRAADAVRRERGDGVRAERPALVVAGGMGCTALHTLERRGVVPRAESDRRALGRCERGRRGYGQDDDHRREAYSSSSRRGKKRRKRRPSSSSTLGRTRGRAARRSRRRGAGMRRPSTRAT